MPGGLAAAAAAAAAVAASGAAMRLPAMCLMQQHRRHQVKQEPVPHGCRQMHVVPVEVFEPVGIVDACMLRAVQPESSLSILNPSKRGRFEGQQRQPIVRCDFKKLSLAIPEV